MTVESLLNPSGIDPPLDGRTPVYEDVGADPRAGAGLDRPPGSLCNFNGAYFWHNDVGPTAWVPTPFSTGGGGGGATVASWDLTKVRYFILDYDAGIDTQPGFIDAAAGSTFTALQTAAVAIKTVEQLYALVPLVGNSRVFVVLQKLRAAGANYLDKDGVTQSSTDTTRWVGYRGFLWRGSSDLSNDAADRITAGFINAVAGPNGDSSFTVAAGATTVVVPIAAGTIAAEAATQFRIRFLPTTATVALRNICRNVVSNVVNTSVTTGDALPAVPAAGDVFVVERPGVRMDKLVFDQRASGIFIPGGLNTPVLAALAFTTSVAAGAELMGTRLAVSGVELTQTTTNAVWFPNFVQSLTVSDSYINELGSGVRIGVGLRYGSGSSWGVAGTCNANSIGAMNRSAVNSLSMGRAGGFGSRSYLGGIWSVSGSNVGTCLDSPGTTSSEATFGDPDTAKAQPRMTGHPSSTTPFTIFAFPINVWRLNFENFGPAVHGNVYYKDIVGGSANIDGCTGDGTGPQGLDIAQSRGLTLLCGTQIANTVTGTNGDIQLGGGAIGTWAGLTKTNVVDCFGNNVIGTAGVVVGPCRLVTCKDADGLAVGEPVRIDTATTNAVTHADDQLVANATCVGVAVTPAATNGLIYVVTDGCPYVLNTGGTVVKGDIAFIALGSGGIGIASSIAPASGKFQQRLGRWITGTSNVDGYLAFNPELIPVAVP